MTTFTKPSSLVLPLDYPKRRSLFPVRTGDLLGSSARLTPRNAFAIAFSHRCLQSRTVCSRQLVIDWNGRSLSDQKMQSLFPVRTGDRIRASSQ
ncbi:MAG TPA: hypothetical protein V6D43_23345 [Candidatus Sericytochromatia bacterium]